MTVLAGFAIQANEFREYLDRVKPAMADNEARPILSAILIEHLDGDTFRLVAADNYRIATQDFQADTVTDPWPNAVVPRWQLPLVLGFLKAQAKQSVSVEVVEHDGRRFLRVSNSYARVDVVLVDGTYPNYRQVIPDEGESTIVLNPDLLRAIPKGIGAMRVQIGERLSPVLMIPEVDTGYRFVVMPVRTVG